MTIIAKPGKENVVTYFLSRLDLPTGEEGMLDDHLLDEHLFTISSLSPWFADIANYLVAGRLPLNLSFRERSRIIRKSAPFTWIGGNIFKIELDKIIRRCVREGEVFDILSAFHDNPCGGHFAAKRTAYKVLQA